MIITLFILNLKTIRSFFFFFQVPPRFTIVPRDAEAPSGSNTMFTCQASGDPVPTIRWSKTGSSKSPTQQLKNGSLLISNIQMADEGRYTCSASNRLKTIRREITITVYSKFQFFCWDSQGSRELKCEFVNESMSAYHSTQNSGNFGWYIKLSGTDHFGLVRPEYSGPTLKVILFDRSGHFGRSFPFVPSTALF